MTCRRPDGKTVQIHSYHRGKSQDSCRVVLEQAYATHMTCVVLWNKAICAHPWALDLQHTHVLTCFTTKRQREELKRWLGSHHGSASVNAEVCTMGMVQDAPCKKMWKIDLLPELRKLRRLPNRGYFMENVTTWRG